MPGKHRSLLVALRLDVYNGKQNALFVLEGHPGASATHDAEIGEEHLVPEESSVVGDELAARFDYAETESQVLAEEAVQENCRVVCLHAGTEVRVLEEVEARLRQRCEETWGYESWKRWLVEVAEGRWQRVDRGQEGREVEGWEELAWGRGVWQGWVGWEDRVRGGWRVAV